MDDESKGLDANFKCQCGGIAVVTVSPYRIDYTCLICEDWIATFTYSATAVMPEDCEDIA